MYFTFRNSCMLGDVLNEYLAIFHLTRSRAYFPQATNAGLLKIFWLRLPVQKQNKNSLK